MRIAVSGTHSVGKSTLIDEFLRLHPEFEHEPEPYTVLVEDHGEEFSAEPCVEDFLRQLEFNLERLGQHASGEKVIYERCPLDFLAYLSALDSNPPGSLLKRVSNAMQHLNLIVYLPLEHEGGAEYPKLQRAMDHELSDILTSTNVTVIEATGSTAQRLHTVENALMNIKHTAP